MWPFLLALSFAAVLVATAFWAEKRRLYWRDEAARAQREAMASESRRQQKVRILDALSRATHAALILLDEDGRLVWANEMAERFLAARAPQLVPRFINAALQQTLTETQADGLEHSRQFSVDDTIFLARSAILSGPPRMISLTVEDITELQRLGRARRDFVANISHDLRTPITTIQLQVETLQAGAIEKPKKRAKLLDSIASQTLTLHQLAQELMDLSMIESGRMPLRLVETPLSAIIDPAVVRLMSQIERQRLQIVRAYDSELMVLADAESLQRVLQNLLHNAIKFTPEGGVITIGARASGDEVRMFVQDTGPGMSPEHLDRIFERFYKTDSARSSGGSGLGLAIAKHIVEGHGGRIWAENAQGGGAVIYFTLLRGYSA